jgi:hypothetical protein
MNIKFCLESLKGRDHLEDIGVDGRIILKRIIWKYFGSVWTGFVCITIGPMAGSFKYSNEHSCSIKGGGFIDYLSDCQLL